MFHLVGFLGSFRSFVVAGEDIGSEREVKKGKSKAKNTQNSAGDSRSKKKTQGRRSSLDSPRPEKSSFASSSFAPEVGKDGVKGKVMDFVKIFSQGASVGAGGESLGQSSRWRAPKETPETDINKDGANSKETVNIPDQQKKPTLDIPAMVLNPQIKILLYVRDLQCFLVCVFLLVNFLLAGSGSETFANNSEKGFRSGKGEH